MTIYAVLTFAALGVNGTKHGHKKKQNKQNKQVTITKKINYMNKVE